MYNVCNAPCLKYILYHPLEGVPVKLLVSLGGACKISVTYFNYPTSIILLQLSYFNYPTRSLKLFLHNFMLFMVYLRCVISVFILCARKFQIYFRSFRKSFRSGSLLEWIYFYHSAALVCSPL